MRYLQPSAYHNVIASDGAEVRVVAQAPRRGGRLPASLLLECVLY